MTFMEEVKQDSRAIWDACLTHPFLRELQDGTLPQEKFKHYMIQDSIYLREYARVFAAAIFKSNSLRDIQLYHGIMGFVTEFEGATRINYLQSFGLTDDDIDTIPMQPENEAYTSFMLDIAKSGDIPEILMAVMPCALSYYYIFKRIAEQIPDLEKAPYGAMILDYASDFCRESCISLEEFAEKKCEGLSEERKKKLIKIFRTSSQHELNFWEMAYKEGQK